MKDDMISRTAILDAVDGVDWYHQNQHGEMVLGASDKEEAWYKAEDIYKAIESVPSAQLAQDLPKGCTDTISRAAVGDALNRIEISRNASWYEFYQKALTAVGTLPSAQPDVSDTNQSRGEVTVYANR